MEYNTEFWKERMEQYGHTGWANAAIYAFDQPIRLNVVKMLAEKYCGDTCKERSLLDFGCGTGEFSGKIEDFFEHIVLYDPCQEVLKAAEEQKLKNACYLSDYSGLYSLQGTYDAILSITVLQHIMKDSDLMETLQFFHTRLREDGVIIIMETFDDGIALDYERAWKFEQFADYMSNAGFRLTEAYNYYHPQQDHIPEFLDYYQRKDVQELRKLFEKGKENILVELQKIGQEYNKNLQTFLFDFTEENGSKFLVYKKQ